MRRLLPALLIASAIRSWLALSPGEARAEQSVGYLVEQLKTAEDYRVRTQAALGLGASGDDAAVKPLCDALGDANASVKVAAAAGLGKLGKPAGLPCLKAARARETSASVKAQIDKSIAALDQASAAGGSSSAPPPAADAKFYVAIQVTNKTTRTAAEIDGIVRAAMQDKILAKKGYAVAPKAESPAQGGQVVKGKKLKGFLLTAAVDPPAYGGGDLTQVVHVTMWSYPEKSLQGELAPRLTQSGTSKGDSECEYRLI